MKTQYHREITSRALGSFFDPQALEEVILANLGQDALRYQIGHDHYHYDSSSFASGDAYCEQQRLIVVTAAKNEAALAARQALGRLTHTVQDLYAHSNYVAMWCESHAGAGPDEIEPQAENVLRDARLHSGKLYYPLEVLSFIPALNPYVIPLLPKDSHAWMNLDGPGRPGFDFAFSAAVKRTSAEFIGLMNQLSAQELTVLTGMKS